MITHNFILHTYLNTDRLIALKIHPSLMVFPLYIVINLRNITHANAAINGLRFNCIAVYGRVLLMSTDSPCLEKLMGAEYLPFFVVLESPDGLRCHISIGESTIIDNANPMNIASERLNFVVVSFRRFMNKIRREFQWVHHQCREIRILDTL